MQVTPPSMYEDSPSLSDAPKANDSQTDPNPHPGHGLSPQLFTCSAATKPRRLSAH